MTFEEQLNQLTKLQIEIADLDELNVEWYTNYQNGKTVSGLG